MDLAALTTPRLIFPRVAGGDAKSVLRNLADLIVERSGYGDARELSERLIEREEVSSTGLGGGVAIPHCKVQGRPKIQLALGKTPQLIDFAALDGQPVRLFFVVISPEREPAAHLRCLAAIAGWIREPRNVQGLLDHDEPRAIYDLLRGAAETD